MPKYLAKAAALFLLASPVYGERIRTFVPLPGTECIDITDFVVVPGPFEHSPYRLLLAGSELRHGNAYPFAGSPASEEKPAAHYAWIREEKKQPENSAA